MQTKGIYMGTNMGDKRSVPVPMNVRPVVSFEHHNSAGMARTLCHITDGIDSRSKAFNLYPEGV
jgi:hypothetical protein